MSNSETIPAKTWVLVADRVRARLYEQKGRGLEHLRTIEHPEGRTEDQDLEAGQSVRSFDRHAQGRAAADRGTSPHERSANQFAVDLALLLDRARQEHGLDGVVLVAEPRLLGMLRGHLTPQTASLVVASITKDLHATSDREIARHLEGMLPPS